MVDEMVSFMCQLDLSGVSCFNIISGVLEGISGWESYLNWWTQLGALPSPVCVGII